MNRYGYLFNISIYGESHAPKMGVIIDGVKPGLLINLETIENDLRRRRPAESYETSRVEEDKFEITSGIKDGYATGAPLHIEIYNKNMESTKYETFKDTPRPGTSDMVAHQKYNGFNDYRGAGQFSGRLTSLIVIAGSIAKQMSPFIVSSRIKSIGGENNSEKFEEILNKAKGANDSVGGVIELIASEVVPGLGAPMFSKLSAEIAHMMFSIPSIKGVDFGLGFGTSNYLGSQFNDEIIDMNGTTKTNNCGGINAGISNGNDIVVNCVVKPISSIGITQKTINLTTQKQEMITITGRHDSSIIRRIQVVLEAGLHIVLLDQYLLSNIHGKK